jgi:hypothetical protein
VKLMQDEDFQAEIMEMIEVDDGGQKNWSFRTALQTGFHPASTRLTDTSLLVLWVPYKYQLPDTHGIPDGFSTISRDILPASHIHEKKLAIFIDNGYKISFFHENMMDSDNYIPINLILSVFTDR